MLLGERLMKRIIIFLLLLIPALTYAQTEYGIEDLKGKTIAFVKVSGADDVKFDCFYSYEGAAASPKKLKIYRKSARKETPQAEIFGHTFLVRDVIQKDVKGCTQNILDLVREDNEQVLMLFRPFETFDKKQFEKESYADLFLRQMNLYTTYKTEIRIPVYGIDLYKGKALTLVKHIEDMEMDGLQRYSYVSDNISFDGDIPVYCIGVFDGQNTGSSVSVMRLKEGDLNSLCDSFAPDSISVIRQQCQEFVDFLNTGWANEGLPFKFIGLHLDVRLEKYADIVSISDTLSFSVGTIGSETARLKELITTESRDIKAIIEEFIAKNYSGNQNAAELSAVYLSPDLRPRCVIMTANEDVASRLNEAFGSLQGHIIEYQISEDLKVAFDAHEAYKGHELWLNTTCLRDYYNTKKHSDFFDAVKLGVDRDGKHQIYELSECGSRWYGEDTKIGYGSVIGGDDIKYHHFMFEGIAKQPTLLSERNMDWFKHFGYSYDYALEHMHKTYGLPKEMYYLVVSPIPDFLYDKSGNPRLGSEIKEKIYIPFTKELLLSIKTTDEVDTLLFKYREERRKLENQANDDAREMYETLVKIYGEEIGGILFGGNVRFGFTRDMCMVALRGEPYRLTTNVRTPLGIADCCNFYTQDIALYFIDDILIGIAWRGNALEWHM